MKELLRKTFELVRAYPVLCAPYLVACLLAFGLWRLRATAEKGIIRWFTTSHSVLGGTVQAPIDYAALERVLLVIIPLGLATLFVTIWLFVVVLAVTCGMVDSIGREQGPNAREAVAGLSASWGRILLFSLKFLLAIGVVMVGVTAPLFFVLRAVHHLEYLTSHSWLPAVLILYVGCLIWLMMPAAIRLLRPDAAGPISTQIRNRGTILAVLVTEAGYGLGILAPRLEKGIVFEFRWELTALSAFNSVLANVPDVLLFIALALLANETAPGMDSETGSKLRKLLHALMPLHFRRDQDPQEPLP